MKNTALLFAGQGAQSVGMGQDLVEAHEECRRLFDSASEVLGYDLAKLCFEGPDEELTRSDKAQPAIFVVSAACYVALKKQKPEMPCTALAGLSLGEWTALYAAEVLSFEDVVRLLEARGRFMQDACEENPGGMLSVIGLQVAQLQEIAAQAEIEVANLNSPAQTVLSGTKDGIEKAKGLAEAAGAKRAIPLNVAGAFHSSLMKPAAEKLASFMESVDFRAPQASVISNVTAEPHGTPEEIKQRMVDQVTSSVRWVESIEYMKKAGVEAYVECGPGKVLTGLVKRIDKEARLHNIHDLQSLEKTVAGLEG